MGRHRKQLTRTQLLERYAELTQIPVATAERRHGDTNIEELRDMVEGYEARRRPHTGEHSSFAKSQPTTTVQGQTR